LGAAAPARAAALTEGPRLAAIYDDILDAKFDRVDAELNEACPPAPPEACQALGVASLWWQILVHPESRLLDQRLVDASDAAIAASTAWTRREPQRAEAWFYLAAANAPIVQWHVLRGERVAAARDGSRIKTALEHALQLDPTMADAQFGIGIYHYYADVAPAAAKLLRWLLFLPGGDRVQGLQEILRARDHGELLRGEAAFQLQLIYLWYEHKPEEALAILERLDARYQFNPLFLQRIAEAQETYLHDHEASAASWRLLLSRARGGRVFAAAMTEVRARLGLAAELVDLEQPDEAIEQLQTVIAMRPAAPAGARARAETQLRTLVHSRRRNFF